MDIVHGLIELELKQREHRKQIIIDLQAIADEWERKGNAKEWLRAMRKLAIFSHWDAPGLAPASIPVSYGFYLILEIYADQQNEIFGTDIYGNKENLRTFRGLPVHPEIVVP